MKFLKSIGLKVQGQIMEDQVRVTGKNRDEVQAVIAELKAKEFGLELSFGNYR